MKRPIGVSPDRHCLGVLRQQNRQDQADLARPIKLCRAVSSIFDALRGARMNSARQLKERF
ncbi:MAG TPA: hypothetical protein VFS68_08580, partial [Candidatus Udaeobacter sp.]|nr:hypothetical protein [Candidatus Udaeobacter sp.]